MAEGEFDADHYKEHEFPRMLAMSSDDHRLGECCCHDRPRWIYAVCCVCGSDDWGCNHLGHSCHDCFMRDVEARHEQQDAKRRSEDQSFETE